VHTRKNKNPKFTYIYMIGGVESTTAMLTTELFKRSTLRFLGVSLLFYSSVELLSSRAESPLNQTDSCCGGVEGNRTGIAIKSKSN